MQRDASFKGVTLSIHISLCYMFIDIDWISCKKDCQKEFMGLRRTLLVHHLEKGKGSSCTLLPTSLSKSEILSKCKEDTEMGVF